MIPPGESDLMLFALIRLTLRSQVESDKTLPPSPPTFTQAIQEVKAYCASLEEDSDHDRQQH